MPTSWTLRAAALSITTLTLLAGCSTNASRTIDGTMSSDYALFQVDNDQAQRNEIDVTVSNVAPGDQLALFFAPESPRNTGWFQLDPSSLAVCPNELDAHCEAPGYGYLVDVVTAAPDQTSVTLFDGRASEDVYDTHFLSSHNDHRDWTGRWAVMRIGRTGVASPVTFHVVARPDDDGDFVDQPDGRQLQ